MILSYLAFLLAAISVIGNDSLQVLGTFISSNRDMKWYIKWLGASILLIFVLTIGWYINSGDISYGRLDSIPFSETKLLYLIAPIVLFILTRYGIPVSTTVVVLSIFASKGVLTKIVTKSFLGYGVAIVSGYIIWFFLSKFLDETKEVKKSHVKYWKIWQIISTSLLWSIWLMHDMANIAVYFPRSLSINNLIFSLIFLIIALGYMFYKNGGRIQKIIMTKSGNRFLRSATIIDFVYFFVLLYFKMINNLPMSTTFVFVGLITGRELAVYDKFKKKMNVVFPIVAKDFGKLMIGIVVSIVLIIGIQNIIY